MVHTLETTDAHRIDTISQKLCAGPTILMQIK